MPRDNKIHDDNPDFNWVIQSKVIRCSIEIGSAFRSCRALLDLLSKSVTPSIFLKANICYITSETTLRWLDCMDIIWCPLSKTRCTRTYYNTLQSYNIVTHCKTCHVGMVERLSLSICCPFDFSATILHSRSSCSTWITLGQNKIFFNH